MKLKTVTVGDKTYAEISDGKPVYVHDDGKEAPFDGPDMYAKILRDGKALVDLRKSFGEIETKLKAFEGIEDPEAARKAIETMANLDAGKLLSAGKVEEIKLAARKAAEDQVAAANKNHAEELARTKGDLEKRTLELNTFMIGGGFSRSKLITDPKHPMALVIPADIAQSAFGKNFKVEEGKIVAYDNNNNKIFSRSKPGDLADFDEALETLVSQYPYKDQIIRGSGNRGDGARGSNGAGGTTNEALAKMSPVERMNAVRAAAR